MANPIDELGPGTGTATDPYIIKDLATLDAMRNDPYAHYMMVADVDIGGGLWVPFDFYGVLDGRGYRVTSLQVDTSGTSSHCGFFSEIKGGGEVRNIAIETGAPTHVTGDESQYCGVLAGNISGAAYVENVLCRGVLNTGGDRAGGVCGRVDLNLGGLRSVVSLVDVVGGGSSTRVGAMLGYTYEGFYFLDAVFSSEISTENTDIARDTSYFGDTRDLTIAQLADPANYPDALRFDLGFWEIGAGDLPRLVPRPVPIIEISTGGTGDTPARVAGVVTIDEVAAARKLVILGADPSGARQVVGEGESDQSGQFDITYDGWGTSVVVMALDDYGDPFEASVPLELGAVIHPSVPNGYVYLVSSAGTTGAQEPVWTTDSGVTSGSVTFSPQPFYRPVASGPLEGELVSVTP